MKPMHLLILAGAGVGLYFIWKRMPQQGSLSYSPYAQPQSGSNLQFQAQPSLKYPVQPISPPRVDNTSQPWYGGDRSFNLNSPDSFFGSDFQSIVSDFQGLADLSGSLTSIYDDLGIGSWFSDEDPYGGAWGVESYDMGWQSNLAFA